MAGIIDPFLRQLVTRLAEETDKRIDALAHGGAFIRGDNGQIDPVATVLKYQADVTFIHTMQQVIEVGIQIDNENHGGGKTREGL